MGKRRGICIDWFDAVNAVSKHRPILLDYCLHLYSINTRRLESCPPAESTGKADRDSETLLLLLLRDQYCVVAQCPSTFDSRPVISPVLISLTCPSLSIAPPPPYSPLERQYMHCKFQRLLVVASDAGKPSGAIPSLFACSHLSLSLFECCLFFFPDLY